MKNFLIKFLIAALFLFSVCTSYAESDEIVTPYFTIQLPQTLKLTSHYKIPKQHFYHYVYMDGTQELHVTALGHIPADKKQYHAWEEQIFHSEINVFPQSHHLDMSKISKESFKQKPELFQLGKQNYVMGYMLYDNTVQTYFLVTIAKNMTYVIILLSRDKNPVIRAKQIISLVNSVKTMKFLGDRHA
ncbi:MAG TPA: hypothetical protein VGV92_03855 [Gammaproteobacteria bacterium]|nr:hypothetical protein [Gammaproteobacteria bacterium]